MSKVVADHDSLWLPASSNSYDYRISQELGDHGILVKFLEIRWPQNSYIEFWLPASDYRISQELGDHEVKQYSNQKIRWSRNAYEMLVLDDHRILMKF